jgi:CRP/FNR family transcriptional regulator, anaerobic regulatory protein
VTAPKAISCEAILVACESCSLRALCLPMGLALEDVDRLDSIVKHSRSLLGGDHLFREGDRFRSLYVVKSGSAKTCTRDADGDTQVLGFHLPGEITGLDGIEKNSHACSAQVLETSLICEIPYGRLEGLSATIPSLQHQMYRLLSKEIAHENEMLLMLATKNADERLATFLVNMSGRLGQRGLCATDFCLSMSRHDIANYLGLSAETVSRGFTRFQNEGLLKVDRKHVQLLDVSALEVLGAATPAPTTHRF